MSLKDFQAAHAPHTAPKHDMAAITSDRISNNDIGLTSFRRHGEPSHKRQHMTLCLHLMDTIHPFPYRFNPRFFHTNIILNSNWSNSANQLPRVVRFWITRKTPRRFSPFEECQSHRRFLTREVPKILCILAGA